ncbi:MAG: DEAD/DEAH box helicase [Actinobacteria bacterium 13_1_20CM_3_68_9]|nr:MAG: DEAD/DEAH box helicase [Actinobacteria bacterium 13_1_20CM_3_68_9]
MGAGVSAGAGWERAIEPGRADARLVAESVEAARAAAGVEIPASLAPELAAALPRTGIEALYSHQLEALEAAARGNAIVTSGTASGKSLSFNLPVLDGLVRDGGGRALYLYPTKALAQDQARKLSALALPQLRHAIYDGDTPRDDRPQIRRRSNLILTNPDMLHVGILPHHKRWGDFLASLGWVVVDEAHTYRGVFGSHVANVLRRLRRVAGLYGASPRFILASATIANPVELAERLVGEPFHLVDSDGAPRARRRIGMWNPPVVDPKSMRRRSVLSEAAELLADLVCQEVRTICFLRSRRGIELIQRFTRMRLDELGRPQLAERIAPYRAGYTPQQRREIETRLVAGELLAVVATDALELGIDIGELDAAICVTFPGTVASLRQMWGRAGRRREGLALYVAGEDALDQFFCRHPEEFLERPVEAAILDHENERIQLAHLLAAAYEVPLSDADSEVFGQRWRERADALVAIGELRRGREGRYLPRGPRFPAGDISLRSASPDSVAIVERASGELLGSVEAERAFTTVHPGAVYLHLGRSYEVRELDIEARRALVDRFDDDWYTQPKKETEVFVERLSERRDVAGVELSFGEVSVTEQVMAFQRKRLSDHQVIDMVGLDLPETNFPTQALWYVLGDDLAGPASLPPEVLLGALHATEHGQIAVLPLLAMCDRWDIGGLSTNVHFQTGRPTIFIYDGHPGGVGIARRGFELFERLLTDAAKLIGECPCADGCPSCVQSPKCGNLNEPLHKQGALELMTAMLGRAPRQDARDAKERAAG